MELRAETVHNGGGRGSPACAAVGFGYQVAHGTKVHRLLHEPQGVVLGVR